MFDAWLLATHYQCAAVCLFSWPEDTLRTAPSTMALALLPFGSSEQPLPETAQHTAVTVWHL